MYNIIISNLLKTVTDSTCCSTMRRLRSGGLPRPHLPGQREVRAGAGRGARAQDLRQPQETHVSDPPSVVLNNFDIDTMVINQ